MRVTSKGQVTIPQEIREKFRLLPNTEVDFVTERGRVYIVKARASQSRDRGRHLVERMRGTATIRMSTDKILALTRGTS